MLAKTCKYSLLAAFIFTGSTSHATLIDNGGSTTDTATGLEWLDLTATRGISPTRAEAIYASDGYRYATDDLVSGLLSAFNITYQFNTGSFADLGAAESDRADFLSLFGRTGTDGPFPDTAVGQFDVDGRNAYACIGLDNNCNPASFTNDRPIEPGSLTSFFAGVFLVRNVASPVPAPATLALLGLGLTGLAWSRRKNV